VSFFDWPVNSAIAIKISSARHHLDDPLGRSAEPQVRSMQGQHDQHPEDDRETDPADRVGAKLAGRPGAPQQHDGRSEKPGVESRDHRDEEHLTHDGVRPRA
jgi:hypothetical protein